MTSRAFVFQGLVGALEVDEDRPNETTPGRIACIAHPHPLFGGTKDNKVVQTLSRSLQALGFTCWRPNFRGVGSSEGTHDNGQGEADDLFSLVRAMLSEVEASASVELVLAGFSFGSFVQAQVAKRLEQEQIKVSQLILVAPAVTRFSLGHVREGTLLIHGEVDDVVSLQSVIDWARPQNLPLVVVPGADHFFHRKLTIIKNIIFQHWGRSDLRLPLE